MPPVRPFRTALYLSLGLAVFALGLAGGDLLPEIPYLTGLSLVLLGIAFGIEGRWQLSLRDANLVGLALAGLLLVWGVFQFVRPPTGIMDVLPWPASALPYLAPVLMILIPAKMYRPKHAGDYWTMHGLALLAMAMACALAQDGAFAVVFAAFAAAFIWSLAGFSLYREAGPVAAERPMAGGRWRALKPAVGWAMLAGGAAIPLFWITPRTGSQWELGLNTRGKVTGVSDGPVDLNATGTVAINRERAFEVYVEDRDGRPVLDLPADQKFRAILLQQYEGGRWGRNQFGDLEPLDKATSPQGVASNPRDRLPDFGPDGRYLTFVIDPRLTRTPPVIDPVAWRPGDWTPAVSRYEGDGLYRSWIHRKDGSIDGAFSFEGGKPQYVQAWAPPAKPGAGPVMRVRTQAAVYLARLPGGLSRLRRYTDELVARFAADGTLPREVLTDIDPDTRHRKPKYHEAIGRALEHHLAASGEFTYTLDLARKDKGIDPTEDFVLNVKAGHCNRFATALVLMLRTQGVPCQMVIGYRGADARGDGWYDVREDSAHAWVEILIPAPGETAGLDTPARQANIFFPRYLPAMQWGWQAGGALAFAATPTPPEWEPMRWQTLDPTPSIGGPDDATDTTFFGAAREKWEALFKALLLAYNTQSREQAVEAVKEWTAGGGWAYLLGGAVLLIGVGYWRRRRAKRRAEWAGIPDPLRRLVEVLTKAGFPWPAGQTAREWARKAGAGLESVTRTVDVAGVPERVVSAYYAARFGGRPIGADEQRELSAAVGRLAGALA
jgi:transglutaminase-like putative cysteine protease